MKKVYNTILILFMFFFDIIYIINALENNNYSRIATYLALPVLLLIPFFLEKIIKKKLNTDLKIIYFSFIFLADFLGCIVGLYNSTIWFDKFTHFLSGIFTAFLGLLFMQYFKYQDTRLGRIFCVLGFSCFIAVIWEFFEYGMDSIFNLHLQHADLTGVGDTMKDLISAFLGSILFLITYQFDKKKQLHSFIYRCKVEK